MEDTPELLDFFVAEISEADRIVNCVNRRILGSVNRS
jgi:hypothetical protein